MKSSAHVSIYSTKVKKVFCKKFSEHVMYPTPSHDLVVSVYLDASE